MVALPFPEPECEFEPELDNYEAEPLNWVGMAASGALITGGVLLATGQRRAGLAVAASGAALAMLDQKETLAAWWSLLPVFIDEIQNLLDQVQGAAQEVDAQREKLHKLLAR
ncbi:MAG: hypothetical protein ABR956_01705 [Terracidiphilus sp.]|jgi:hypothetical protein